MAKAEQSALTAPKRTLKQEIVSWFVPFARDETAMEKDAEAGVPFRSAARLMDLRTKEDQREAHTWAYELDQGIVNEIRQEKLGSAPSKLRRNFVDSMAHRMDRPTVVIPPEFVLEDGFGGAAPRATQIGSRIYFHPPRPLPPG